METRGFEGEQKALESVTVSGSTAYFVTWWYLNPRIWGHSHYNNPLAAGLAQTGLGIAEAEGFQADPNRPCY